VNIGTTKARGTTGFVIFGPALDFDRAERRGDTYTTQISAGNRIPFLNGVVGGGVDVKGAVFEARSAIGAEAAFQSLGPDQSQERRTRAFTLSVGFRC
jgi:hypothetical protein